MNNFHHRKLPKHSTLLVGRIPNEDIGCKSEKFQIWYNNSDKSWVGEGENLHMHSDSDECFIVLKGSLVIVVDEEEHQIGPNEFCFFPKGMYHGIRRIRTPIETLMIRAPTIDDKVYK